MERTLSLLVDALHTEIPKFKNETHIKEIKTSKIVVRSALGVLNPNLWIHSLNIGNVMNLNPMPSDELG